MIVGAGIVPAGVCVAVGVVVGLEVGVEVPDNTVTSPPLIEEANTVVNSLALVSRGDKAWKSSVVPTVDEIA